MKHLVVIHGDGIRVMGTHHKDGVEKLLFTVLKVRVLLADKHYIKIQQYV